MKSYHNKNGQFYKGMIPWNKNKHYKCVPCSDEKKLKISISNTKHKIDKICLQCKKEFKVWPSLNRIKFCSRKCAGLNKIGKPAWNKGLKGFRAGKNHHWYGRDVSGEKNPTYKKDRTQLKGHNSKERRSSAYILWRTEVWKRDNFKCKISNKNCKGRIEAHHILGFTKFPELRYDIKNGITLCHFHHPRKRVDEANLSPYFQELVKNVK